MNTTHETMIATSVGVVNADASLMYAAPTVNNINHFFSNSIILIYDKSKMSNESNAK